MGFLQNTLRPRAVALAAKRISKSECSPAAGTNAAAEINGDSARPLGNSRLSYRSLKLMRRGVDRRAIGDGFAAVHESGHGPSATSLGESAMSAVGGALQEVSSIRQMRSSH